MSEFNYDLPGLELDEKIESAVCFDDDEGLISLLARYGDSCCLPSILDDICLHHSVKCAAALLEGKLGIELDVNEPIVGRATLLHLAAQHLSKGLVQLSLDHGAQTDVRLVAVTEYNGLLPLNIALHAARRLVLFIHRGQGLSTLGLIAALCLPVMESPLAAIKLLASSSKDIEEDAYNYAMEGKLIELACLLIVARDKALVPIEFCRKDGTRLTGSMTLRECLPNQIMSLVYEEINLIGEGEHEQLAQIHKKIMAMRSAALLIDVFERAGNRIEESLLQQPDNVQRDQVERDVASLLTEAGFNPKAGDFNFCFGDWVIYSDSMRTPIMFKEPRLDNVPPLLSPHLLMLEKTNAFPTQRKGIPHDGFHWSSVSTLPFHRIHHFSSMSRAKSTNMNHAPKTFFGSQYFTSSNVQVKKVTDVLEHNRLSSLSGVKFAQIARLIKKGLRCA